MEDSSGRRAGNRYVQWMPATSYPHAFMCHLKCISRVPSVRFSDSSRVAAPEDKEALVRFLRVPADSE